MTASYIDTSNLNKHLKAHGEKNKDIKEWLTNYTKFSDSSSAPKVISEDEYELLCYFSHAFLVDLENPHFKSIARFKLPGIKKFKTIIEEALKKLRDSIGQKVKFNKTDY